MRRSVRFLIPAALAWLAAACSDATPPTAAAPDASARPAAAARLDVRDRWIVVFNDRVARPGNEAREVVNAHGGTLHFVYEHAIRGFAATLSPNAVEALRRSPNVKYVVEDGISTLTATQYSAPWGLDRTDQRARPLDGSYTYQSGATGQGVNAYVLDSGIRFSHAEFGGRAVPGADYVGDGQNGNDCFGHGTHVAGILGGSTYGVAKAVKLISVRVVSCSNSTFTSAVVAGLDWIRYNHVKPAVVNISLTSADNLAQDDAVRALLTAGVTVVSSAGNGPVDVCNMSSAYIDGVITVGATDANDARWAGSNYGYCMDVFAPGVNIPSASYYGDTDVGTLTGTSMAAPHVTGAVARYLQTAPGATPAQAHAFIVNNATTGVVSNPGYMSPNRLLFVDPALGGTPPAANITGATSITSAGTYTWQANATGGSGAYGYTWEYRLSGGAWSVVGSGSSYSRSIAAGDPAFELRVTVTSGGLAGSDTHAVGVSIATALSAYISGPDYVMSGTSNTWYANPSGGTGAYTYQWQYRSESSGTWSSVVGTASSYTRLSGRIPFYLRLTVTSAGSSVVAEYYVYVEGEPTCGKYLC